MEKGIPTSFVQESLYVVLLYSLFLNTEKVLESVGKVVASNSKICIFCACILVLLIYFLLFIYPRGGLFVFH